MPYLRTIASAATLLAACLAGSAPAQGGGIYRERTLAGDAARYEQRIQRLYEREIRPWLSSDEIGALEGVSLELRLPEAGDHPLDFPAQPADGGRRIVLAVLPLKMLEDLSTAWAWLADRGYSLDTIDDYAAMLGHRDAAAFPGGRYPQPLDALGVPRNALADPAVDEVAVELRNTAWSFLILHQIGHLQRADATEAQADGFALSVFERSGAIPAGAVLVLQAEIYRLEDRASAARLARFVRSLDEAAARERRAADRLHGIAGRVADLQDALHPRVRRCITEVADRSSPTTLAPRHRVSDSALGHWCGSAAVDEPDPRLSAVAPLEPTSFSRPGIRRSLR